MIELQNVTKLYGRVIGVNDITLSLPQGAYGLLGPNGAGKSTLLNIIMGQLTPTIGTVTVFGESPVNNAELYRKIGYCPSHEGLYSNVSALEWVRYLQQLNGFDRDEANERARKALDFVNMTEAMDRPISTYSRGMRQRTKLAQALAHNPQLVILDEPFNGLDPIGRHDMTLLLRKWIEHGRSLIFASHVLHEIESLTRSFLLICGGRLLASGTSEEVHTLLTDLPNEITLHSDQPKPLASWLAANDGIDTIRISGTAVTIATRHAGELLSSLPALVAEQGIEITEVHSADESLQSLFNSLMKIHRGEL
jgi:ABC-2 type transport system ATP-binding protein